MSTNPLIPAVELWSKLTDAKIEIDRALRGDEADRKFDPRIADLIQRLIARAAYDVDGLDERARTARLDALWRGFLDGYSQRLAEKAGVSRGFKQ
jgi:hypothetical protein